MDDAGKPALVRTAVPRARLHELTAGVPPCKVAMESFFSSLKTERLSRKVDRTRDELRADVFDYI